MTLVLKICPILVGLKRTYKRLVALLVLTQLLFHGMSGAVIDLSNVDPLFANVVPRHDAPPRVPSFRGALAVPGLIHNNGARYRLYAKCAKSHVQIRPRSVNARAASNDRYTDLIFHIEDDSSGRRRIRIQGAYSKLFVCFNKRGKLIARFEEQSERCQFVEHQTPTGYTELQSVANHLWFVGFRKNGKPMRGYKAQQRDRRRCFGLIKTPVTSQDHVAVGVQSNRWSLPHVRLLPTRLRHHRQQRQQWRLPVNT